MTLRTANIMDNFYKIKIEGILFEDEINFELPIEYDHNFKYYQENKFICKSSNGLCGINTQKYINWYKGDYELVKKTKDEDEEDEEDNNKKIKTLLTSNKITLINTSTKEKYDLFMLKDNETHSSILVYFSDKLNDKLNDKINNKNDIIIGSKISETLKITKIEHNKENSSIFYTISRSCDMIYSIEILNKINNLFGENIKIEFVVHINNILFSKDIKINDINDEIYLNNMVILLQYNYNLIFLKITCNNNYINNFRNLKINIGNGFANSDLRQKLARNLDYKLEKDV